MDYLPQYIVYEYTPYNKEFKVSFEAYIEKVSKLISNIEYIKRYYIFYLDGFKIEYKTFNDLNKFSIKNHGFNILEYCSLYDNKTKTTKHFEDVYEFEHYIKYEYIYEILSEIKLVGVVNRYKQNLKEKLDKIISTTDDEILTFNCENNKKIFNKFNFDFYIKDDSDVGINLKDLIKLREILDEDLTVIIMFINNKLYIKSIGNIFEYDRKLYRDNEPFDETFGRWLINSIDLIMS